MTIQNSNLPRVSQREGAIAAASLGLLAGVGIGAIGAAPGDWAKSLMVLAGVGGAAAATTAIVSDYRHTSERNEMQQQIAQRSRESSRFHADLERSQAELAQLRKELELSESLLGSATAAALAAQAQHRRELEASVQAAQQAVAKEANANTLAGQLQAEIAALEAQLSQLTHDRSLLIDRINALLSAQQEEIAEQVAREAAVQLKALRSGEIKRVAGDYESVAGEMVALFEQFQAWGAKVKLSHESKSDIIRGMASQYNATIDELRASIAQQTSSYIAQIEILNEKLARAYAVNQGEILEVQKRDFGFSPEGKIANAIAVWVYEYLGIPLAVGGFHARENGAVEVGYGYSKNADPAAIVKALQEAREVCARNLGLYRIESIKPLDITACIVVTFRRDRPLARADKGTLYRSQEDFLKYLLSSRLFFRFIGSPGSGKTPTVMVVLARLLERGFLSGNVPSGRKLNHTLIEFCNPLDGISVKNGSETEVFHRWSDPKEALKGLKAEYEFRKDPANKRYQQEVGYVWVCDEFTNAVADMSKDQLKGFMKTLRDGGHSNMGAIVMAQEVMVSKAVALSIEDQKFFINVLLDSVSIRTFLEEYGKKFYSENAIKAALATLEQIEAEIEETNEYICDTARQLRVAMVLADRSPVFYQLPYFDSADIDLSAYGQTLRQIAEIRGGRSDAGAPGSVWGAAETLDFAGVSAATDGPGRAPMPGVETAIAKPVCPHCGSTRVRSKGNKWLCEDSAHNERAANKPKSWNK